MPERHLFTSESVTEGHPDKVADQISDSVVDAILDAHPEGRVACETLVTTGVVIVAGEISTTTYVDIPRLVRDTVKDIGYCSSDMGFDYKTCSVLTAIDEQSQDIYRGVEVGGAGDQGMMFGYACRDTEVLMPLPIMLAHRLAQRLSVVRKEGLLPWVRPDGKTQVSIEYDDGRPVAVETIVISTQHAPDVSNETIAQEVRRHVIEHVLGDFPRTESFRTYINPTGRFVTGGPLGDAGLTGRKIIVDTYGGAACHGGGCFSGKDPTKVDRSAAYAARQVAKTIVAAGLADRCQFQVAYAIGVAEPVSLSVETFGTGREPDGKIVAAVREVFDLTPRGIIERLKLRRGIFKRTAAYGHFGREEPEFTWEDTGLAGKLKEAIR